jgi:hypothetical protein
MFFYPTPKFQPLFHLEFKTAFHAVGVIAKRLLEIGPVGGLMSVWESVLNAIAAGYRDFSP